MRWRVFTVLAGLTLLAGMAAGVLSVRSYSRPFDVARSGPSGQDQINAWQGQLRVDCYRYRLRSDWLKGTGGQWVYRRRSPLFKLAAPSATINRDHVATDVSFGGFRLRSAGNGETRMRHFIVPVWWVAAPLLVLPLGWMVAWRRRFVRARRRAGNRCVACGYDLRASAGHCPECGRPVPPPPSIASRSPPRVPKLIRLAAAWGVAGLVALLLATGVLAALVCLAIPRTSADHFAESPWFGDVRYEPVWRPASGGGERRMYRYDGWGAQAYQALWNRDGQEFLVVLRPTPQTEFQISHGIAGPYDVYVFDRTMSLVRKGFLDNDLFDGDPMTPPTEVPYCLMEVFGDHAQVPAGVRGRWDMAVGALENGAWDASLPVKFFVSPERPKDRQANYVRPIPIRWAEQVGGADWWMYEVPDARSLQFRMAEVSDDVSGR